MSVGLEPGSSGPPKRRVWRDWMYAIIFEAETPAGKGFDVVLLVLIVISVFAVMLESVAVVRNTYGEYLRIAEWVLTILFTVEYLLRLVCVHRPARYAISFFGVVDVLAVLPTYLSLVVTGSQSLIVIRALRLLRLFRIFKLARYLGEARVLVQALKASHRKITVFLGTVLTVILIVGTLMYLIEGEQNGFTSIPKSLYWAIVTMTTVGYGDLVPQTTLGQFFSAILMIMGYGIIAVPTGIMTAELTHQSRIKDPTTRTCPHCVREGHTTDAQYCKYCGAQLN